MSITNKNLEFLKEWKLGKLIFTTQNDTTDPGEIYFGINGNGIDITWFGTTAGSKIVFDESGDSVTFTGITITSTAAITGITPTSDYHLSTKKYVDDEITTISGNAVTVANAYTDTQVATVASGITQDIDLSTASGTLTIINGIITAYA